MLSLHYLGSNVTNLFNMCLFDVGHVFHKATALIRTDLVDQVKHIPVCLNNGLLFSYWWGQRDHVGITCMQKMSSKQMTGEQPWTHHAMNSTTKSPHTINGDVAVSYVLVPFFLITFIGIVAAVVGGIEAFRKKSLSLFTYLLIVPSLNKCLCRKGKHFLLPTKHSSK